MENIYKFVAYFIIYSFGGWILESIYKTVMQKKIVNSGFLYGPFCPMYGIGAIIMLLFLSCFSNSIILLFFMSFIVLSIWEYIVGVLLEKIFRIKYWDYSSKKFNFKGRICLDNSIMWGLLGVTFIMDIHPKIEVIFDLIPENIVKYFIVIVFIILIIDIIASIIKIKDINIKRKIIEEIATTIKESKQDLRQTISDIQATKRIKATIRELKQKQKELKEKLEIQTQRLRKAFPTMNFKDYKEAINKRIKKIKGEK